MSFKCARLDYLFVILLFCILKQAFTIPTNGNFIAARITKTPRRPQWLACNYFSSSQEEKNRKQKQEKLKLREENKRELLIFFSHFTFPFRFPVPLFHCNHISFSCLIIHYVIFHNHILIFTN